MGRAMLQKGLSVQERGHVQENALGKSCLSVLDHWGMSLVQEL